MSRRVFHKLVSIDDVESIVLSVWRPSLEVEEVDVLDAFGRVVAEDVYARIDVPPFDRATMDGYAVVSYDVEDASEERPVKLKVIGYVGAGDEPKVEVVPGTCVEVATGAPIPRGADAVVPVEYCRRVGDYIYVFKGVAPGDNIQWAGTDIMAGEVIARRGEVLTPGTLGVLSAAGVRRVRVFRRPRAILIPVGNELVEPGEELSGYRIYEVNSRVIKAMLEELGFEVKVHRVVPDDESALAKAIEEAANSFDIIVTFGGTSAGLGDLVYRVVEKLGEVLLHGINVKPGKPTLVGIVKGRLLLGLPGYPLSAAMIFARVFRDILAKAFRGARTTSKSVKAVIARDLYLDGRRTLKPVVLSSDASGRLVAYPIERGSGSISAFADADGFIEIPENTYIVRAGDEVEVKLFTEKWRVPDILAIGSNDAALEKALATLSERYGYLCKSISVGSMAGIRAAAAGICDIAGTHILDEETMEYNVPVIDKLGVKNVALVRGFARMQGIVVAKGNPKNIRSVKDFLRNDVVIVNRVKGSGTRTLLDKLLKDACKELGIEFSECVKRIRGYRTEAKTHAAVALAVKSGRADAGICIEYYARLYNLEFIPLKEEIYDFIIPLTKLSKPQVKTFLEYISSEEFRKMLEKMPGYKPLPDTGRVVKVFR